MADAIVGTGHGLTTAEWSTSGATNAVGIITGYTKTSTADKEPIPDQAGGEAGTLFYNKGGRLEVTALLKNGQTAPAVGASVTVNLPTTAGGNFTGIVDTEPKVTGRLRAWMEVSFTVYKPDAMTLA